MRRFYYEYDKLEDEYEIIEDGGGYEHGQHYDVIHFWVATEQNAKDAVELLNRLYEKIKNETES